jgi:glutathione synthase/RimK-type ligase-like ATP-grasp enzyme
VPHVALATCVELPDGDEDASAVVVALHDQGIDATFAAWDDPGFAWEDFDLVVVRSTWDYALRRDAFVAWARARSRVANPAEVLAWNTDKRYLRELAAGGIPVIPTRFVAPGEAVPANDGEVVVKPAISGGAKDTIRHPAGGHDAVRAHVAELHGADRVAMVQPYLTAVDSEGEAALVYFDGRFSHAARKGPLLTAGAEPAAGLFAPEDMHPLEVTAAQREVADELCAWVTRRFGTLLYARVDLVAGADGAPVLLELELTEPSFFLAYGEGSAERFAAAVAARV